MYMRLSYTYLFTTYCNSVSDSHGLVLWQIVAKSNEPKVVCDITGDLSRQSRFRYTKYSNNRIFLRTSTCVRR